MKKRNVKQIIKSYIMVTFGVALSSLAYVFFLDFDNNKDCVLNVEEGKCEEFQLNGVKKHKDGLYFVTSRSYYLFSGRVVFDLKTSVDTSDNEENFRYVKPFFTKSTDWEYEKEVRCVISSKNPNIEGFDIDDCLPYLDVKITKIFIGINVKDDDLNEVLKLAYHRDIPVVYMEKHPTDFTHALIFI